jgi:hypothetical protein
MTTDAFVLGAFAFAVFLGLVASALVWLRNRNVPEVQAEVVSLGSETEQRSLSARQPVDAVAELTAASVEQPPVQPAEEIPAAVPVARVREQDEEAFVWEETPDATEQRLEPVVAPVDEHRVDDEPDEEALVDDEPLEDLCQIVFWRGYLKSGFYARSFDEEGHEVAVAESPLFRGERNGIPYEGESAVEAYEALVEQLQADGWTLAERGDDWFSATFRRDHAPTND